MRNITFAIPMFKMNSSLKNKPFNWAIIGTGRIANTVAEEIVKSGRHKIRGVYSRTQSKAESFARKFGAVNFEKLSDLLQCGDIEGIYIATPHSVHYSNISECVLHGKPVLCEKAFTVNSEQALRVIEQASSHDVYLCEGMWTRFNPVVQQIVKWIKDDKIGDIKSVSANFSLPLKLVKPFVSERVYTPEYAGGALLDLGVYPVAYAHLLLGVPDVIDCRATIRDGVDFHDAITFAYNSGAVCTLQCSFDKLQTYTAKITGTKGKIVAPMFYKPSSATLISDGKTERTSCKRGYIYQFDAVAVDIRNGKKQSSVMPLTASLEIMKLLDECRRQNAFIYPENIESL